MWGIIIAAVWYFARNQPNDTPNPAQEQAMWDAARHYQEHVRGPAQKETDIPDTNRTEN